MCEKRLFIRRNGRSSAGLELKRYFEGGAVLIDKNGSTDGNTGHTVLVGPNDDPETEKLGVTARGREFGDHIHDFGCFRRYFWGEIQKTAKTARNPSVRK